MAKKNEFNNLYSSVQEEKGKGVIYTKRGEMSVMFQITNPVEQYCADVDAYYEAAEILINLIKILGDGYALQKQDIFCKQQFHKEGTENMGFLSKSYFDYFEGRQYTELRTYITITQEIKHSTFIKYDHKKWNEFWQKIQKVEDALDSTKVQYTVLNKNQIVQYVHRFLGVNFKKERFSYNNIKVFEDHLQMGTKAAKIIDMVDIDEVIMPATIKPYAQRGKEDSMPNDLFAFLGTVPNAECIIYTQSLLIPNQRRENAKLASNRNRKRNIPDPANLQAAEDINNLINDIARDNKMLVYTNYSVLLLVDGGEQELTKPFNYLEKSFYDLGIGINKNAYNQLELFINSFPGNEYSLKGYERFLCLHDAAVSFCYKERMKCDENTPLKVYYTDRQGVPIAIDISGKEGKKKLTTNSNFFSLGPSGSGKSFHMNSVVRQLHEQNTDIVMVDTGNSYEGLCAYFNGTYIAYTEEKPITMNPFRITEEERNVEKMNFLKSLVFLIWKGADAKITKTEDELMDMVLNTYYDFYFNPFDGFSNEKKLEMQKMLRLELKQELSGESLTYKEAEKKQQRLLDKIEGIKQLAERGVDGEKKNAERALQRILEVNGMSINETDDQETRITKFINKKIESKEDALKDIKVTSLSFNSFYEFAIQFIPIVSREEKIPFDINDFKFVLKRFYKGGTLEKTLNDDFDNSLFDESFIVFEVDAIKDDPTLFPIVTLIIMDVFIQKMRIKKNRKALIIEEAWKAIASPMMAGYIKYLYKTVRKFWGIVGVVTQELNDIISNETVKEAIVNNSEITILLDQSKFKERYGEIAKLLGLSLVEQRKIWTINKLDNKEGRGFFKEVYIRRGTTGDVFGVEEAPQSYMAYTTERVEKDALKIYVDRYNNYDEGIRRFCEDWAQCCGAKAKADAYANIVNEAVKDYTEKYGEKEGTRKFLEKWVSWDRGHTEKFIEHVYKNKEEKK
jgi:type IV secretory pathway VirB4 component